jgi:hypothetical protein
MQGQPASGCQIAMVARNFGKIYSKFSMCSSLKVILQQFLFSIILKLAVMFC